MGCRARIVALRLPLRQRHTALSDCGRGGVHSVVVHDSLPGRGAVNVAVRLSASATADISLMTNPILVHHDTVVVEVVGMAVELLAVQCDSRAHIGDDEDADYD